MSLRILHYKGFTISVAEGWDDITDILDEVDPPLTLADPDLGVGALQLSPALYKKGAAPHIKPHDLTELLFDFTTKQGWTDPFDRSSDQNGIIIEAASYHSIDDFIRVWYASDGTNIILATYICDWSCRHQESSHAETSVKSIRFS